MKENVEKTGTLEMKIGYRPNRIIKFVPSAAGNLAVECERNEKATFISFI